MTTPQTPGLGFLRSLRESPATPARPTPALPVTTIDGHPIDRTAAQRILVHDELRKAAGFADATPWFAIGTTLVEAGREKYQQSRAAYDALPRVGTALPALIEAIRAERRVDIDVKPDQLRMRPDGTVAVDSPLLTAPVAITESAFAQFARWLTDPRSISNPARYFADIEPERRAQYVNDELERATKPFRLRTRTPNGDTEIFAVTSQSYTAVDADVIAHELLKHVDPEARADVLYRDTRTKIGIIYHSPLTAEQVAVGDYYKAAQTFRSNDDGTARLRASADLYRAICRNLTTVVVSQEVLVRRHVGDLEQILAQLGRACEVSYEKLRAFLAEWGYYQTVDSRDLIKDRTGKTYPTDEPSRIFHHLFQREHKAWTMPGVSPEAVAQAATEAWFAEPADWSVAGLSNALSRAAHEAAWADVSTEELLQVRAGQLVKDAKRAPWGFTEPKAAV